MLLIFTSRWLSISYLVCVYTQRILWHIIFSMVNIASPYPFCSSEWPQDIKLIYSLFRSFICNTILFLEGLFFVLILLNFTCRELGKLVTCVLILDKLQTFLRQCWFILPSRNELDVIIVLLWLKALLISVILHFIKLLNKFGDMSDPMIYMAATLKRSAATDVYAVFCSCRAPKRDALYCVRCAFFPRPGFILAPSAC